MKNQVRESKLKISFGEPEHGWLDVKLQYDEFHLMFNVSDVPVNPIEQLTGAIIEVLNGYRSEVFWHLEPSAYYFAFEKDANQVHLEISFQENHNIPPQTIFFAKGNAKEFILPIYREIKKFASKDYSEVDWPLINQTKLLRLKELIHTVQ